MESERDESVVVAEPVAAVDFNDGSKEDEDALVAQKNDTGAASVHSEEERDVESVHSDPDSKRPRRVTIGKRKEETKRERFKSIPLPTENTFEKRKILTFSFIVNGLCFFLLIFSAASWSPTKAGIRSFYWSYGRKVTYFRTEYEGNDDEKAKTTRRTWYGLQSLYSEVEFHVRKQVVDVSDNRFESKLVADDEDRYKYSDSDCSLSQCDDCEDGGRLSFRLVISALIFTFVTTVLLVSSFISPMKLYILQAPAAFLSLLSMCLTYSAVGVYVRDCYYPSNDEDDTQQFGPGFAITLLVSIMLTFTLIIQIIDFVVPDEWE